MNDSELTPWFDGHDKPSRVGVYMLRNGCGSEAGYQHWDGAQWGIWCATPDWAHIVRNFGPAHDVYQLDNWRGLLAKPKARKEST